MSIIISPIYTAIIGGHRLRFFKSPLHTPDMAWHALYDLMLVTGHTANEAMEMLRRIRSDKMWANSTVRIATSEGPLVIAPHWMAQGQLGAMVRAKRCLPEIETAYILAGSHVLRVLVDHLPEPERVATAIAMARGSSMDAEALNV